MRRTTRLAVALLMVTATFALAVPAAADRPYTSTDAGIRMGCSFDAGVWWADTFMEQSADYEWADITIWDGGSEPLMVGAGLTSLVFGEGLVEAEIELAYLSTWETAGSAILTAAYEPGGDTEIYDDRWREGNRWVEVHDELTPLLVTASLEVTLTGEEPVLLEALGCWGDAYVTELWMTNPAAWVDAFSGTDMSCELTSDGWFVSVWAWDDGDFAGIGLDAWAPGAEPWFDEQAYWGFAEFGGLDEGALAAVIELWAPWDEEPTGEATVDGMIAYGDVVKSTTYSQNSKMKRTAQSLEITGTLTLPDRTFDLATCDGAAWTERSISTRPNGPQVDKGPVPANDGPDRAEAITKNASGQTRNAVYEPEAACLVYDEYYDEYWEMPIGKTLWYTVKGTGKAMTVDTAGSDFDTIVGVYTMVGDELTNIGCVDDVFTTAFSLQAAISFDTVKGQTYYIQAGGFGGQYGHLKLSVK